jgi:putative restriction endonuclease
MWKLQLLHSTLRTKMDAYIGVTDFDWYRTLIAQPGIDEVNFWKPGGEQTFAALPAGGLFLFKLHAPRNYIVGGGLFAHFTRLPISMAWEAFGIKNGATSLPELRARVERFRRIHSSQDDYSIGCILLEQPFLFAERDWIPAPSDWKPNIVQGRRYDLSSRMGQDLWEQVTARLQVRPSLQVSEPSSPRFGHPVEVLPRLGQGSFRVVVTDAYERRCAITGERTLPALDAAHIKPYSAAGENRVPNGILLRSDLHRLFDRGYLTVTPDLRVRVSPRIRQEFENGRHYYEMDDWAIRVPPRQDFRPDTRALEWHAETVFLK